MADRKRTSPLDWDDLRYFVELARHGSLSGTARALHVNHATVARRLAHLEQQLGRPLFDRRREGYGLTADGEAVRAEADAMDAAALAVLRRLDAGNELSGLVRVTATRGFADHFLAPCLGLLRARHPAIDLEILGESRSMSLARREAEIALRLARPQQGDVLARRLAAVAYRFYAAPAYLKMLQRGGRPSYIAYDEANGSLPEAQWLARHAGGQRIALRANSAAAQLAAAQAGFGIALLPCFLVGPRSGVRAVELGEEPPARELWLLVRRDLARTPRVRAVVDAIVEIVERERALLAGRAAGAKRRTA